MTELEKKTYDNVNDLIEKNRQIEEMAKVYEEARCKANETLGSMNEGADKWYAKAFYTAGYRKASEVARESIAEFKELVKQHLLSFGIYPVFVKNAMEYAESELKKKYTEGEK